MQIQTQKTIGGVVLLLLCAQSLIDGKFCNAQVGFAWEPRCASPAQATNADTASMSVGRIEHRGNALDFDAFDSNEVQRSVLFDYFNANRPAVYSADGISGWDTECKGPIASLRRDRQQRDNIASRLGEGQYWVDPLPKRAFVPSAAPAHHQTGATMHSPLAAPHAKQPPPSAAPLIRTPPAIEQLRSPAQTDSNVHSGLPELDEAMEWEDIVREMEGESFPPPEEYEDAAGDFEWDDSFLDELPELNRGEPVGNPLPPSSNDLDAQGSIHRPVNSLMAARPLRRPVIHVDSQVRRQFANPSVRPQNALQAAMLLEAANNRATSR